MSESMSLVRQLNMDKRSAGAQHDDETAEKQERKKSATEKRAERMRNVGLAQAAVGDAEAIAGTTMQASGKTMQLAGQGMQRGGAMMTRAGAAMSSTGMGAIVGVPLAIGGAATTSAGAVVNTAGKGVDNAGRALTRSGQRNIEKGLNKGLEGQRAMQLSKALNRDKEQSASGGLGNFTSGVLRKAWLVLIPSFGLSIIYIDAHAFMHNIFPNVFCGLGEEWSNGAIGSQTIGKSSTAKIAIRIGEMMLFVAVNFMIGFIILLVLTIVLALIDSASGVMGFIFNLFS